VEILPDGSRVRYVEVEVHEEREIEVPKTEIREVVKEIKVPEYQTREVVQEEVTYEDKIRTVERIIEEEREIEKKVKERREVPVEKVIQKVVDVHSTREERVEVPVYVEVDKPYTVERKVDVARYNRKDVPCVVAQKLRPVMREEGKLKVETHTYEPVLYAVDVYVPKPVSNAIVPCGKIDETHQQVNVPAAQYNTLTHRLNPGLEPQIINEVCLKTMEGHVPMLPAGEIADIVHPLPGAWQNPNDLLQMRQMPRGSPEKKHKKQKKHHSPKKHHHH
jgi:hypothetical protein